MGLEFPETLSFEDTYEEPALETISLKQRETIRHSLTFIFEIKQLTGR